MNIIGLWILFWRCCNVLELFTYKKLLLNNPTKKSLVDKVGEWGDHLDFELLEIILPLKIFFCWNYKPLNWRVEFCYFNLFFHIVTWCFQFAQVT